MQLSVEIEGIEEAIKKLQNADRKTSVRFIRSSLRYAAIPAIDKYKQLVPVDNRPDADDYSLRDSIGLRAERKKNRAGNATSMRFGSMRETNPSGSGYAIKGGLNKGPNAPNYAAIVEEKTPVLLSSVQQTTPEIIKRFGQKVIQLVKKL